MSGDSVVPGGGPGITRVQLEAVIRRAAELYAAEADADERLSADEVLRIAAELGLPERYVRRALYELPAAPATLSDRVLAPAGVRATRAVPGEPDVVLQRLEEYLTTREYLQLKRRQGDQAWFEPAGDAISSFTRALSGLTRPFHLVRARGVLLAVRPLEPGWSHVRIELDFANRRRKALVGGSAGGLFLGAALGTGAFMLIGAGVATLFGSPVGLLAGAGAALAGLLGGTGGGVALAARGLRRRLQIVRVEIEGLLDRLERGERLDPPPAPWKRRLELAGRRR